MLMLSGYCAGSLFILWYFTCQIIASPKFPCWTPAASYGVDHNRYNADSESTQLAHYPHSLHYHRENELRVQICRRAPEGGDNSQTSGGPESRELFLRLSDHDFLTSDMLQASLEQSIALFEGSYLADTAVSGGNIIKVSDRCWATSQKTRLNTLRRTQGFDNYMKAGVPASRRRAELNEEDRLFSKSSGSHQTVSARQAVEVASADGKTVRRIAPE